MVLMASGDLVSLVSAQGHDSRVVARALAQEGAQLYEKGDFQGALEKFQQAYKQFPSPKIFFNLGQVLRGLSRNLEALDAFERFLAEAKDASADYREQATAQAAELYAKVARVTVGCNRRGALVIIDGDKRGTIPLEKPVNVQPGVHQLAMTWEGETKSVDFVATVGQVLSLLLNFDVKKQPPEPVVATPKPAPVPPPRAAVTAPSAKIIEQVILPVAAGSFMMGDDDGEVSERPEHKVALSAYAIDKYEVTQTQWERFLRSTGRLTPTCHWDPATMPNHPVVCVSWFDAQAFCESRGGSLPTEAQWERAARGGDKRKFPWGDEPATCNRAIMDSGQAGCGARFAVAVGSRPLGASPVGTQDLAGNVSEWVWDNFLVDYYDTGWGTAVDPRGPASGTLKVIRGGCWGDNMHRYLRSASRMRKSPAEVSEYLGFRCAYPAGKR